MGKNVFFFEEIIFPNIISRNPDGDGNLTMKMDVTIVFSDQKCTSPQPPVIEIGKSAESALSTI